MIASEVTQLICDGDTGATRRFVGIGLAKNIATALEELFMRIVSKNILTTRPSKFNHSLKAGRGDRQDRDLTHAAPGLIKSVIGC